MKDVRVSDAERGQAVAALWEHYETGRLKPAEHEERCTRATAARTRDEIETLFADLPAPHPDLSAAVVPVTTAARQARRDHLCRQGRAHHHRGRLGDHPHRHRARRVLRPGGTPWRG